MSMSVGSTYVRRCRLHTEDQRGTSVCVRERCGYIRPRLHTLMDTCAADGNFAGTCLAVVLQSPIEITGANRKNAPETFGEYALETEALFVILYAWNALGG